MSDVKWTKEQLQAIEDTGSNILVAAAAGSGKTAVLVERIIHKIINEKMDINKMLVVTFTNAAASEMRERILKAIYTELEKDSQNVHLQKQITLLNKANICTIHSFCLEVIRNNFYEIDMPSNFRIADTAEIALLKQDTLDALFEQKYEENNKEFIKLLDIYASYHGDEALQELILNIYDFIQSSPFPQKWLEEKLQEFKVSSEQDFGSTIWGELLLKSVKEEVEEAILWLQGMHNKMYSYIELAKFTQTIAEDIIKLQDILSTLNSWDTTYQKIQDFGFKKWPVDKTVTLDLKEEAKSLRDKVRKKVNEKVIKVFSRNSSSINSDFETMLPNLISLSNLVLEFSQNFTERKKEKNCVDFNDIEHLALKILVGKDGKPTETAKKYQEKFLEIAIDEYQDSNLVQEAILTSISSGKNIFMVGDVKQSIYKFRGAKPELFLNKYETYNLKEEKKAENGLKIQLFRNFRSRENILDFTNLVFETIMSKELGDILYNETEYLNYGANYPEPNLIQLNTTNPQNEQEKISNYAGTTEMLILDLKEEEESITAFKDETEESIKAIKEEQEKDITAFKDEAEESLKAFKKEKSIAPFKDEAEKSIAALKEEPKGITALKNTAEENKENEENEENEEEQERIEDEVLEARLVANKIQELLKSGYMVYDKKAGYRPIKPKDIVILLRATSAIAPIFEKEISDLGLPVFSDSSNSYLESVEIETILAVLKIIDNPLQDIPLVVVLRSIIGNFTDNDLIEIRLTDRNCNFYEALLKARLSAKESLKNKIENIIAKLENWKEKEKYMPLDELIWQIYLDTGYYQYVGLLPNGAMRQANLKNLFEKAKQYETASYKGLFNFIHFIEKLKKQNGDLTPAKLIGENEDVVRIMSIHKSKGLEFPVVFLCNSQKKFNLKDLNDSILLHQDIGFGPTLINSEKRIKYNTLAREAIKIKMKQETLSEEERILYVALTRAKEKLFITGRSKDFEKELTNKKQELELYKLQSKDGIKLDYKLIQKGKSYLDWLLDVYLLGKEITITLKGKQIPIEDIVTMKSYSKKELINLLKKQEQEETIDVMQKINENLSNISKEEINKMQEELANTLKWKYPHLIDTKLPTKTSVTSIKQEKIRLEELKDENASNENMETYTFEVSPRFLQEKEVISNARKGSLVHLCIQKLDEKQEYTLESIKNLIQSLVEKEIITEKEAEAIDINLIYNYTKSNLFKELKTAKELHKEQPFYISLPASEVIKEAKEEGSTKNVLVQGIIDLYYINQKDELILIDFKTDYVGKQKDAKQKLKEKYKVQLELYKKALETATGKEVAKAELYLLRDT